MSQTPDDENLTGATPNDPAAKPAPARTGLPPLSKRTIAGLVAAALLMIGSFASWGTVSVELLGQSAEESIDGMDSDGELTLVAAIVAAVFLVLRRWPGVVLAAALVAVMITIYDTAQTLSLGDLGTSIEISLGWGLILALLASLALTMIAVLQIRDANAEQGKLAAIVAGAITALFVVLAIAGVFDEDVEDAPASAALVSTPRA